MLLHTGVLDQASIETTGIKPSIAACRQAREVRVRKPVKAGTHPNMLYICGQIIWRQFLLVSITVRSLQRGVSHELLCVLDFLPPCMYLQASVPYLCGSGTPTNPGYQ